jgi:hypothetical protein
MQIIIEQRLVGNSVTGGASMKTMLVFLVSGIAMLWTVGVMAQSNPTAAPQSQQVCSFKLGPVIFARWQQLSQSGYFGCPLNSEGEATPSPSGTTGRWAQFLGGPTGSPGEEGSLILHTSGPLAGKVFSVNGCLFQLYSKLGGPGGKLGFPITDERTVTGGVAQDFEGGDIQWAASTSVCKVVSKGTSE